MYSAPAMPQAEIASSIVAIATRCLWRLRC